ncbi:MAG: hypothetical protein ACP5QP_03770 [Brevinematia bacterium]
MKSLDVFVSTALLFVLLLLSFFSAFSFLTKGVLKYGFNLFY